MDKGGNVVPLNEDYYVGEVLRQSKHYCILQENPLPNIEQKLDCKLTPPYEEGFINKDE